MAVAYVPSCRSRVAALVLAAHLLVAYAILNAPAVRRAAPALASLTPFRLLPLAPPEPPKPVEAAQPARRDAPAPPAPEAVPTEIVAPRPIVIPPPAPLVTAPVAGPGSAPSAGASLAGSGTGAGGEGDGLGGGGEDEGGTHSRWKSGRIKPSDYPLAALEAGASGTVAARVIVGPDGRVASCAVIKSSGNADLDAATCRIIAKRFRYVPGRDATGNRISDEWVEEHDWTTRREEVAG